MAVLVWRCLLGSAPAYLGELCRPVSGLPGRRTLRSFVTGLEPCANVIVSPAARRSILVGGGAQTVPKNWRRWQSKKVFSKIPEKTSFYPQNFLMTVF